MAAIEARRADPGEHIFTRYVDLKRAEWDEYRVQVTPWSSIPTWR